MSALPTRVEREAGRPLTPLQIFDITASRKAALSRLLMLYIGTGLVFMLLPGTFLGVWNLLEISSRRAADSVSAGWVQAHGHAQIFGWIGTFILGIGFYSIPKLRRMGSFALSAVWSSWVLWTAGVTLRWVAGVYGWHWRVLLPGSATFELAAFLIFFRTVSGHRPQDSGKSRLEEWVVVVIAASIGLLLTLLINLWLTFVLAFRGTSPEVPVGFDQKFLALQTWGFLVPFVWGFSAKWLPVFLGLRPLRARALLVAVALNSAGIVGVFAGWLTVASLFVIAGIIVAAYSLCLFEPPQGAAKVKGVHPSFPAFVRLAYVWALVAALLGIWATLAGNAHGILGASRHALTVGFLATMVFAIGQRVLPAFSGMRLLFSPRLMFAALTLLTAGCLLRVSAEILAYQGFLSSAWSWLPVSAVTEMSAVTLFALNMFITFARRPPSAQIVQDL